MGPDKIKDAVDKDRSKANSLSYTDVYAHLALEAMLYSKSGPRVVCGTRGMMKGDVQGYINDPPWKWKFSPRAAKLMRQLMSQG